LLLLLALLLADCLRRLRALELASATQKGHESEKQTNGFSNRHRFTSMMLHPIIKSAFLQETRWRVVTQSMGLSRCGGMQNISNSCTVLLNLVDRAYQYEQPDHWRLPLDSDQIPYRFKSENQDGLCERHTVGTARSS
jgi:hypothetical protein